MMVESAAITAIVLCGGHGSRMGGRDKPLLEHVGRPMIAHITDALNGAVACVLISANRNLEAYGDFGRVVEDELSDQGPLAGIASCLQQCATEFAFICPGDAPSLDASLVQRLAQALGASDARVAVVHDGQRRQNLHLLMHADVQSEIASYLASGARSVKDWLESMATIDVDCADIAACFADIDAPGDLQS
jgi:molybdopterin-guanine dinucleotide biosynthesis protein A